MRLDTDIVKAALAGFIKDLRGNRLWPLAIVLLVAIVAVPIVLSKSASSTPVVAQAQAPPPPAAVPALNVQSTSTTSRLPGHGRDPFSQHGSTSGSSAATPGVSSTGSTSANGASGSSTGSGGTGSTTATTSTVTPTTPATSTPAKPPSITPAKKPTPAPPGLSSTQSYQVELAMTNASGGVNTIDSLQRLSVLPSGRQPLLVELGVLKGGNRVLFAVQPGTVVGGPGLCTPGPADCEIMSLGAGQTEAVGVKTSGGQAWSALFAISKIAARNYSSAGAANRARRSESAAGRAILNRSSLGSLSLFRYNPSVGAVLDLRSLTVGAS